MSNINPTIEMLPTAGLVPYARNSRAHSPEQVAQIAGSIREFGFTNPDQNYLNGDAEDLAEQAQQLNHSKLIRVAQIKE